MNRTFRNRASSTFAAAALALSLVGCTADVPSSPTPTPSVGDSASVGCLREGGGCLGVLEPGSYESQEFTAFGQPSAGQLRYTVDGFWANALDHTPAYWFQPATAYAAGTGDDFLPGVYVWGNVAAAAQDFPACPEQPEPGVATDAAGLIAWLAGIPGLVTQPLPSISFGGAEAEGLDLVLGEGAPECSWGAFVPLLSARTDASDAFMWGVGSDERMHLYLADLGNGHTAAVIIDAPTSSFEDILPHAQELIATFEFSAP